MSQDCRILKLFANCIPVKGWKRGIIADLQRQNYFFVPNSLCELFQAGSSLNLADLNSTYKEEELRVINEYIQFLLNNELAFFTNDPDAFPALENDWDAPFRITNMIIDIDESSQHPYQKIFNEIESMGIPSIQLRFYSSVSSDTIRQILLYTKLSRIRQIEFLMPYDSGITESECEEFFQQNKRVSMIVFHSSPSSFVKKRVNEHAKIVYIDNVIDSHTHCGVITPAHFRTNIYFFTEARLFNSCLNRKISIDSSGEIRNCPSCQESFGNISSTSMSDVVSEKAFHLLGGIKKDDISVCKDCEFRYICLDCRAFRTEQSDIHSKPLKCGYNPYNVTWEDESVNPQSVSFKRITVVGQDV